MNAYRLPYWIVRITVTGYRPLKTPRLAWGTLHGAWLRSALATTDNQL